MIFPDAESATALMFAALNVWANSETLVLNQGTLKYARCHQLAITYKIYISLQTDMIVDRNIQTDDYSYIIYSDIRHKINHEMINVNDNKFETSSEK